MSVQLEESRSARFAMRCAAWAEKWFPDSWVFAVVGIAIVVAAALAIGVPVQETSKAFGKGFWSLIPFTMQMAFVVIGGYVVASSKPASRLIEALAKVPGNGRSAVAWVALISMVASLLNWGLSLVFGGLLVKALARRTDLKMDYRAAGAAAYLGLGAVWALGISSSGQRSDLVLAADPEASLQGADCLAIVTEWQIFRAPDFGQLAQSLRDRMIFDGRNLYDPALVAGYGLGYVSIGRQPVPRGE